MAILWRPFCRVLVVLRVLVKFATPKKHNLHLSNQRLDVNKPTISSFDVSHSEAFNWGLFSFKKFSYTAKKDFIYF